VAYDKHKELVTFEGQHVIIITTSSGKNRRIIVEEMRWRAKWHSWRGEMAQLEEDVEGATCATPFHPNRWFYCNSDTSYHPY